MSVPRSPAGASRPPGSRRRSCWGAVPWSRSPRPRWRARTRPAARSGPVGGAAPRGWRGCWPPSAGGGRDRLGGAAHGPWAAVSGETGIMAAKRILVVGAGHVGLYAALPLSRKTRAEVIVVDPQPHMTYQPFLPEA